KLRARVSRSLAGRDVARVVEFMGELVGVPFPDDDSVQLRAARADAVLMSDQVARAWETFVEAEAAAQPLVILLEDAHWGDGPSMELLDASLRALEQRPLFIVAIARPELRDLFPRLWEGRPVSELRLSELTRKAAEKLVRAVLPYADDRVVVRVIGQASGNAFYLEELMRAVASGKSKLPETVLAMVEARLDALDADARRVLRAASVFGQVCWRGGVAALIGADLKPELLAKLDALVEGEVLARRGDTRFPGQVEYVFRQSIVREAAYAMLTEADRTLGHELAARWLESVGEVEAVILAEHHERGGNPGRAAEIFLHAAREARDANDLSGAIARAEQGVACGATGALLGHLRLVQAEAHRWRDENGELAAAAEEALANLPAGEGPYYAALGELATGYARIGQTDALAEIGARLVDETLGNDEQEKTRTIARVTNYVVYQGLHDLGRRLIAKLDRLETAGNPSLAALVHTSRATWLLQRGDVSGALGETRAAVAMHELAGDARNACFQRSNLGGSLTEMGLLEEAIAELRAARAAGVAGKLRFVELVAALNLGLALAYHGELDEARATLAELVQRPSELPTARIAGGARVYYAITCCLAGDFGAAEQVARGALASTASSLPLHAFALGAVARAELGQLKRASALLEAERAYSILEQLGSLDAGDAFVRLTHAEVVYASGDAPRAARLIGAAELRLRARAELIADPVMRASFLARVPENAATLARAAEWRR
ncbi:MAG TPA: serine/threonine-protein kinase PknK, partial [Byssovorax sp.]